MSSYFRPDSFGVVLLRLVETDRDVRRPGPLSGRAEA